MVPFLKGPANDKKENVLSRVQIWQLVKADYLSMSQKVLAFLTNDLCSAR